MFRVMSKFVSPVSKLPNTHTVAVENLSVPSAGSGYVLSVKVIENVRVPSLSELEISVQVKGCTDDNDNCYMLEGSIQNSDVLVARAVVTLVEIFPVHL